MCGSAFINADTPVRDGGGMNRGNRLETSAIPQTQRHRAPARTDLLLVIEDSGITIRFNGDFGPGYYQISDNEPGISVSGSVNAEAGSSEFVAFPISSETSFDFDIEFEDGSWSHLTWGN